MDFSWHPMVIIGDSSENLALLSIQKIEQSHGVRQEEIALFLRKVFQCAKKKQVVDVGAELMKLTNNITCRMIMSMRYSDESNEAVRNRVSKGGL